MPSRAEMLALLRGQFPFCGCQPMGAGSCTGNEQRRLRWMSRAASRPGQGT
jgi:hypothetical protein